MQKFARIGDRVINLDLVTTVELEAESESADALDADEPERLVVVYFAGGSDEDGSPAVFVGEEADMLRKWFRHDAFDLERAVRDQAEGRP